MRTPAAEAVNATAATTFVAATVGGWTVQEWAAVAALFYTLLLIADKAVNLWQRWQARKRG